MMPALQQFIDIMLHLDVHLNTWVASLGPMMYPLLFLIIFCETGIVVTPFLPGDSLLFALGALCAVENPALTLPILAPVLCVAGILGDAANYAIGRFIGPKVFSRQDSFWLNKKHLLRAQAFYDRHGGKTIILARFMPIIRTFAPFVAGIGRMNYPRFALFNVSGGILWVMSFLIAGYSFGNIPAVKSKFHIVIVAIIVISFLPVVFEFIRGRFSNPSPLEPSERT